jgi:hypothetical protein
LADRGERHRQHGCHATRAEAARAKKCSTFFMAVLVISAGDRGY